MSNHNRQMANRVSGGSSNNTDSPSHCKGQASKCRGMIGHMLLWLFIFLLTGCGMSNEEILLENKRCKDGGMTSSVLFNGLGMPMRVVCKPCDEDKARAKQQHPTNGSTVTPVSQASPKLP